MFHTITHPRLLAVVEGFVGERIIGSSVYRVRPKLPRWERGEVPWHQDSGYFLPHCDDPARPHLLASPDRRQRGERLSVGGGPRSHRNGVYRTLHGRTRRLSRDPRPRARRRSHARGDEERRCPLPNQPHPPRLLREPQRSGALEPRPALPGRRGAEQRRRGARGLHAGAGPP